MRPRDSLPPSYFEEMFAGDADPWRFETSAYEQAKYDHTIAALDGRLYESAFEIGCANGVLTQRLAARCRALLAVDVSDSALARARTRCASQPAVSFERMTFPQDGPGSSGFDLIVMSEVAYYWNDADLLRAAERVSELLVAGGDLLLVHWTGETDYPQTGDGAVESLRNALSFEIVDLKSERRPEYRLDLWRRRPA